MALLARLFSGIWSYAAIAAVSAALAGAGAWRVTAWAKDETISGLKLAQQTAISEAWKRGWAVKEKRDAIVRDADVAEAEAREKIRIVTEETVRHVQVFITPRDDSRCTLNWGFVRLLDAAGLGIAPAELPGAAGEPDGADSGIPLSRAASLLAQDLGDAAGLRERLKNARNAWLKQDAVKDGDKQ